MKVGRNAPCPCGSQRKFKACCGRDAVKKEPRDLSGIGLAVVGAVLILGLLSMVVTMVTSDGSDPGNLVWSAEHGHWHTADGNEYTGPGPFPHPPGPPPPGKVWSAEHGHWHDL